MRPARKSRKAWLAALALAAASTLRAADIAGAESTGAVAAPADAERLEQQATGRMHAAGLARAGKHGEAAKAYREVLALGEDCIASRELAEIVVDRKLGSITEGMQLIDEAVRLGCAQVGHYIKGAGLARLTGDEAKAERYNELAYRLDPTNQDAAKRWGGVLERSGKHKEALAVYTQFLRTDPANAQFRFFIAATHARAGRCDESVRWFHTFLNHAFHLPAIAREVRKPEGGFKGCLEVLEPELVAIDKAEKLRAEALDARGRRIAPAKIIAIYDRAVELAPEWVILMRECAEVCEEAGDLENAKRAIFLNEAFANKAPDTPEAQEARMANARLRARVVREQP